MSEIRVSIIVPTFDRVGYVETAILSVLEQDYAELEVIVVDDGSRDETRAILERVADRFPGDRFRWIGQANAGQASAINRGLEAAGGDLLGYLSSDDFLIPGAISSLVRASRHHPEVDVFYPSYQIVDESDAVINAVHPLQHTLADAVRWSLCMPGLAALVRRGFYERNGGWDSQFHFIPDFEWWLRDPTATFMRVPQVAGGWRFHSGSISVGDFSLDNVRARLEERLTVLDRVFANENLPDEVAEVKREAYSSALIELGVLFDSGATDYRRRRWTVDDNIGRLFSIQDGRAVEHNFRWSERLRARAEHLAEALAAQNTSLHATVAALQAAAVERAAVNEFLRRQLADAREPPSAPPVPAPRPLSLRLARALVPARWRSRVGAAWHRVRTLAR